MFDLMKQMLSLIDSKEIKKDKDFQILAGIYKIPTTFGELNKQRKIR